LRCFEDYSKSQLIEAYNINNVFVTPLDLLLCGAAKLTAVIMSSSDGYLQNKSYLSSFEPTINSK